jgi:hypothetical protein
MIVEFIFIVQNNPVQAKHIEALWHMAL